MKILIAEDNEDSRLILRKTLKSAGHTVREASNGADALQLARKEPPEMLISDILIPGMDGFVLCRMVKEDKELRHIPLFFTLPPIPTRPTKSWRFHWALPVSW